MSVCVRPCVGEDLPSLSSRYTPGMPLTLGRDFFFFIFFIFFSFFVGAVWSHEHAKCSDTCVGETLHRTQRVYGYNSNTAFSQTIGAMRIRNVSAFARLVEKHSSNQAAPGALASGAFASPLEPATHRAHVSLRVEKGCSVIELHNPEARNALTPYM